MYLLTVKYDAWNKPVVQHQFQTPDDVVGFVHRFGDRFQLIKAKEVKS